mmetsp:Transcript_2600/g.6957  ORF Transcript_2600/g.6957 Transcript_2600/m.6957 type:complete len:205 (-) Transcript_2600:163-777(-)
MRLRRSPPVASLPFAKRWLADPKLREGCGAMNITISGSSGSSGSGNSGSETTRDWSLKQRRSPPGQLPPPMAADPPPVEGTGMSSMKPAAPLSRPSVIWRACSAAAASAAASAAAAAAMAAISSSVKWWDDESDSEWASIWGCSAVTYVAGRAGRRSRRLYQLSVWACATPAKARAMHAAKAATIQVLALIFSKVCSTVSRTRD